MPEGTPVTIGGRSDGIHNDEVRRDGVGIGRRVKPSVALNLADDEEEGVREGRGKAGVGNSNMEVAVMRVSMLSGSVMGGNTAETVVLELSL